MSELLLAFQLGLLNMTNPCVLPLYPGFLAYLAGNQKALTNRRTARWLGVITLAGVLTAMFIVGLVLALAQIALGRALAILLPVIYLIVIAMGILLLLQLNPFKRLPMIQSPRLKNPILSSFVYGLLYGPMTLPCGGPLVIGVFAASADAGAAINGVLYTVFFGLGFGLPLVALPFLADAARKQVISWMMRHHTTLMRIAGLILIIVGLIGFVNDWELIRDNLFR